MLQIDFPLVQLDENVYFDRNQMALVKNGTIYTLSRIQFRIMDRLAQQIGSPVAKDEIIKHVWGVHGIGQEDELYVYINRIRRLLESNPKKPKYLLSIRELGFLLSPCT